MSVVSRPRSYREAMMMGDRIPEGRSGKWRVERRTISTRDASLHALSAFVDGHGRYTPEGTYTGLLCGGTIVMSDVPDEMRDHAESYHRAARLGGRVLVHGLGIGMVTQAILSLENVEHVDVVELEEDVLALVAPSFADDVESGRLTIHHGDALSYRWPVGVRWTVAWHDIWPYIAADNLPDMNRLHRRFGRRVDWQGSWARDLCEYQRRTGY